MPRAPAPVPEGCLHIPALALSLCVPGEALRLSLLPLGKGQPGGFQKGANEKAGLPGGNEKAGLPGANEKAGLPGANEKVGHPGSQWEGGSPSRQ